MQKQTQTHESFIAAVAALAARRLPEEERKLVESIKLVYGAGETGLRGVTYYNRWNPAAKVEAPFVEICAFGQENWIQVAGTTIHELGHVITGPGAGHNKAWRESCERLGLRLARAAGHHYTWAGFAPDLREAIAALPKPDDGEPVNALSQMLGGMFAGRRMRACPMGIGTRGGKSRGVGSGSRLRLYECECSPPVKVRVASDAFAAHCDHCSSPFHHGHVAPVAGRFPL